MSIVDLDPYKDLYTNEMNIETVLAYKNMQVKTLFKWGFASGFIFGSILTLIIMEVIINE